MGLSERPCGRGALDVALAAGVAAFATVAALISTQGSRDLDASGYSLLLIGSFALVARRRFPVVVVIVTALCALWYQVRGYPSMITTVPVPFAVYAAVSAGRRRATLVALGSVVALVSVLASLLPHMATPVGELAETKFLLLGWFLAGGVLAEVSVHRRAYIEQVEQRALEAEHSREETARRRAGEERLRIARDLHDSLTHSISIIKVQAGVAVHLARKNGEEVPASLLAIEAASGDAIRELRSTLEVLRQPGADLEGADKVAGLDRLDALIERTRTAAGVPTTVVVDGEPTVLDPAIDAAAFRIVQESLTNVARHAGPDASATVQLTHCADSLLVRVDDDGRARPGRDPIPGVGLIGMRERVAALGGRLSAGPRDEGGFAVSAVLPLRPVTSGSSIAHGPATSIVPGDVEVAP